jgi:hypothetical protein
VGDDHGPETVPGANLPSVDLTGGVAVRLASLCLDSKGRLAEKLLCGTAVRGGLLLDLALAGRVESADDSVVIDPTPTGFEPADRLLAAIAIEPERSLDGWLDERRIGLREVAETSVTSGRWERFHGWGVRRRYVDLRGEQTGSDRALLPTGDASDVRTPADACVASVACASGLLEKDSGRASDEVIALSGSVAWLCTAVVEHVLLTEARYRAEAGALGAGGMGPF